MAAANILAFDVGANFVRYALFTGGKLRIPVSVAMPTDGAESFYRAVSRVVNQHIASGVSVDGIAISMPGYIDTVNRRVKIAGPLHMLDHHSIGRELAEHLDSPLPIWLENDANCAAIAEKNSGNAKTLDDFVVITVDTGIGGAVYIDGHLRHGQSWAAGELGMMIVNFDAGGPLPLHDYATTVALGQRYAAESGADSTGLVPLTLLRRLDEPEVRRVVEQWADYLAITVFNVVVVLNPGCVLIGGTVGQEPALLPLLKEALDRIPRWKEFRTPIKRCRHSNNGCLLGACYAFMTGMMLEATGADSRRAE